MPVLIHCPSCKRKLRVQDHLIGKNIKCPGCANKFQVQAPDPAAPAPEAAPAPPPNGVAAPAPALAPTAAAPPDGGAAPPPPVIPAIPEPQAKPPAAWQREEEPLDVLDPIVVDEPNEAVTTDAPPTMQANIETDQQPATLRERPVVRQGSPARVFAILMGLLLGTVALGVVAGWWISRSVERVQVKAQAPR